MSKKGGLGKGLGAIFGENTSPAVEKVQEPASAAQELLIKNIAANPYQPRCNFDEEKLQELAASIKEFGVVQPVVVRKRAEATSWWQANAVCVPQAWPDLLRCLLSSRIMTMPR